MVNFLLKLPSCLGKVSNRNRVKITSRKALSRTFICIREMNSVESVSQHDKGNSLNRKRLIHSNIYYILSFCVGAHRLLVKPMICIPLAYMYLCLYIHLYSIQNKNDYHIHIGLCIGVL